MQSTRDLGMVMSRKVSGSRCGQMELNMKGTGGATKLKVKVNSHMLTVTSSMATGSTTKPTAKEYTTTRMELFSQVIGGMISSMVQGLRQTLMGPNTTEATIWGPSLEWASTYGQMEVSMKESGLTTKSTDLASIVGKMAAFTKVTGQIAR